MSRARRPLHALFALAISAVVMAGLSVACGSTTTDDIVQPITGVVVRADALSAGRGCGTGPGQLFKYAVLVFGLDAADQGKSLGERRYDDYVASNVYDCFSDAQFVGLPVVAGSTVYALQIFAYNRTAFAASSSVDAIVQRLQTNRDALLADGGGAVQSMAIQADVALLRMTNPTYATTCTAEQLDLVQSLAVCKPLQLGTAALGTPAAPASVELGLATFAKASGGALTCDNEYASVRVAYGVGSARAPATTTRCSALVSGALTPQTVKISPAQAPASYGFDVTLLRADGSAAGTTTCSADTSPALAVKAVCKPIP